MLTMLPPPPLPGRYGVCARLEQQEVLPRAALIGDGIPANGALYDMGFVPSRGGILMKWQKRAE